MRKKNTQEVPTFSLSSKSKRSLDSKNLGDYFVKNFRKIYFLGSVFGSYILLSLYNLITEHSSITLFLPLMFSFLLAICLRGILGPINFAQQSLLSKMNKKKEKQKHVKSLAKTLPATNMNISIESFDTNIGEKITTNLPSDSIRVPQKTVVTQIKPLTAKQLLESQEKAHKPNLSTADINLSKNPDKVTEDIGEYLNLLKETFTEKKKEDKKLIEKEKREEIFLKKLDEVQQLLKQRQDDLKRFKKERSGLAKAISLEKAKTKMVKTVSFTCQACEADFTGTVKKINGSVFIEQENEELVLQKTYSGYSFLFEHRNIGSVHQTFVNLGHEFSFISSEVFVSSDGYKDSQASGKSGDHIVIPENEKFLRTMEYFCSICDTDIVVGHYQVIKYENANNCKFVQLQTQHAKGEQLHLATLRVDIVEQILVANPNVVLLPNQVITNFSEHEKAERNDNRKVINRDKVSNGEDKDSTTKMEVFV